MDNCNYILEYNSFKLGSSNKWCPKVLIKDLLAESAFPLVWDVSLDSEEEANDFANRQVEEYLNQFKD